MFRPVMEWSRVHRLPVFTLVTAAAALALPYWAPGVVWIPLACALAGSALLITRRATDRRAVAWIVGVSFGIRCLLAVTLFVISALELSILPSLQADYGLWVFGVDGVEYHSFAVKIVEAWRIGIDLPSVFIENNLSYEIYENLSLSMALMYAVFGPSPLHVILVNVWLGAMSGLVAYLVATRLGDNEHAAIAASALVAFWPSSLIWSTQLLKDPAVLALDLFSFLAIVALWQRYSSSSAPDRARPAADVARWAGLAAAVFALTFFRAYVGFLLAGSVSVVLAAATGRALIHRRWKEAFAAVAIVLVVGVCTLTAMSLDLTALLSPAHPEIGYVTRADAFRLEQQRESAIADYRRAIVLNPSYAPAYRGLGMTLSEQGDRQGADAALEIYRRLAPDATPQATVSAPAAASSAGSRTPAATAVPPADPRVAPVETGIQDTAKTVVAAWRRKLNDSLGLMNVATITRLRRAEVETGGASLIDSTTFDGPLDIVAYLPRAVANAYLAPFPWQWTFTGGQTGIFRTIASVEVVLIALLVPAMILGCWSRVRQFRPEEWILIVFIGAVAIGYGLLMSNGGTLFRSRLQFLFPSLILAARVLPPFMGRLFGAAKPDDLARPERPGVTMGS